jgi:hypothetical protein
VRNRGLLLGALLASAVAMPAAAQSGMGAEGGARLTAPSPTTAAPPASGEPPPVRPHVPPGYEGARPAPPPAPPPSTPGVWQAPPAGSTAPPSAGPPPPARLNVVTADLFAQAVHYERVLVDRVSAHVGARLFLFTDGAGRITRDAFAVGVEGGLRLFLWGTAPQGLWLGPQVGVGMSRIRVDGATHAGAGWWTAGVAGYTWRFGSGFVLSLGAGVEYLDMRIQTTDGVVGPSGVAPLLRAGLGWSF